MPTIVRKSQSIVTETRREVYNAVAWYARPSVWSPPTDVYETRERIIVRMEIAGLRDEDLEVTVQNNLLMVSGNRSDTQERKAYHQMEIPFGRFSVGIELPARINIEEAVAEYKDGFLTIRIPKET
ncbi:MAG: Hsp20/alpha crystallin family protein [Anaerolineales bacterium]|nr:Hsp20/alpha crystallin family protein [Anaerolineales bacterium]